MATVWLRNLTDQDKEILRNCAKSLKAFCLVFLKHRFPLPFSKQHDQLFEALDDDFKKQVVVQASRDYGKSTIGAFAYALQNIVFSCPEVRKAVPGLPKKRSSILIVGADQERAEERSEDLKLELLENPMILKLIDNIRVMGEVNGSRQKFAKNIWTFPWGSCRIIGADQEIRGANRRGKRLDLIILDDYERGRELENPELREKRRKKLLADIRYSMDSSNRKNKIIVIGTPQHFDSLTVNLANRKRYWHSVEMPMCDDTLKSRWPEKVSDSELLMEYEEYQENGELDIFHQERMCVVIDPKTQRFKEEYFRYYEDVETELSGNPDWVNMVLVDPSKTVKKSSDYTCILGVAVNRFTHRILVRRCILERMLPDEQYKRMFAMCVEINARHLGIEHTGIEKFVVQPVENYQKKNGYNHILITWINANASQESKEKRVAELLPHYRAGEVWHNKAQCHALESQLMAYPKAKYWDAMDCFANVNFMLQEHKLFYVTNYDEPEEDPWKNDDWKAEREREYAQLQNEPALLPDAYPVFY